MAPELGGRHGFVAGVLTVAQALDLAAQRAAGAGETASSTSRPDDEGLVLVRGYIVAAPTGIGRLCTGLAGSFPPQCGGPSIVLDGMDLDQLPERDESSGVAWSGEVIVTGVIAGNVLVV